MGQWGELHGTLLVEAAWTVIEKMPSTQRFNPGIRLACWLTASISFSKASRSFFMISASMLTQASTLPFTVMVLSGL